MDTQCEMKCVPINQSSSDSVKGTEWIFAVVEAIIIIGIMIKNAVSRRSFQETLHGLTSVHNHNQCHQQQQQQNIKSQNQYPLSNMEADTPYMLNLLEEQYNIALSAENYSDAINIYTKAIELDSKNYVSYSKRSAAYVKVGKYEEALQDASKIIQINPMWAEGYSRKSCALSLMQTLQPKQL